MNKNLEGFISNNQFAHLNDKGNKYLLPPAWFSSGDRQSQSKGQKLTTCLILFSLFLLFLFF
jgi:hypothetical protein